MSKVTIGLMVYNEAAYIRETIRSIQQQAFQDFEIVVGDNASTDGSSEIIAELAEQDKRIVHIKRPHNIGALQNWNDIVMQAKGEYFVLAGGHDLWSANYLESLVEELENNQNAVLSFCKTQWLDEEGNELPVATSILDTSGMSSLGKYVSLMFANQHCLYGMTRVFAMRQTRLQLDILGSGEIYLQELAQLGDFVLVENERWYRRKNRATENTTNRLARYRNVLFTNQWSRRKFKCFPYLQLMMHYLILPFRLKTLPIVKKLGLLTATPLILFKYLPAVAIVDTRWLMKKDVK
jgi:glycosyltransferase involved in cell wall biosynthesis